MLTLPQWRTLALMAGTGIAGAFAGISFAASQKIDLYALIDRFNETTSSLARFLIAATPFATVVYGVYKDRTKGKIRDVVADPKATEIARSMSPTPEVIAVADALKKRP